MTNSMQGWKRFGNTLGSVALPALAALGASLIAIGAASAENYPSKPVKFVVPLGAASPITVMARLAAPALSARIGQPVIIDNRPGGGGTIGTREVLRAVPDGYTLLFAGVNHVFTSVLSKAVSYDPIKDFTPIGTIATGAWILVVTPSVPVKSVNELIDYTKANPGKLNWGFGQATGPHLFGEMFLAATGIEVAKISYKAGPEAIPDMLGERIQMNIGAIPALLPLIREGKLRALAVSSEVRSPDLPDVPTMIELGLPRLTRGAWSGLLGPANTPVDITNRLNSEINASLTSPEMKASLAKLGFEPKIGSSKDFSDLLTDEIDAWATAAKLAGVVTK